MYPYRYVFMPIHKFSIHIQLLSVKRSCQSVDSSLFYHNICYCQQRWLTHATANSSIVAFCAFDWLRHHASAHENTLSGQEVSRVCLKIQQSKYSRQLEMRRHTLTRWYSGRGITNFYKMADVFLSLGLSMNIEFWR